MFSFSQGSESNTISLYPPLSMVLFLTDIQNNAMCLRFGTKTRYSRNAIIVVCLIYIQFLKRPVRRKYSKTWLKYSSEIKAEKRMLESWNLKTHPISWEISLAAREFKIKTHKPRMSLVTNIASICSAHCAPVVLWCWLLHITVALDRPAIPHRLPLRIHSRLTMQWSVSWVHKLRH